MTSAKEMLESAQAEFEEDRRRLASDQGKQCAPFPSFFVSHFEPCRI